MQITRHPLSSLRDGIAAAVAMATLAGASPPPTAAPLAPTSRQIAEQESHRYGVQLAADELLDVEVHERGPDMVLTLLDDAGRKLRHVDGPFGGGDRERLLWVAGKATEGVLEVRPGHGAGFYELSVRKRPATDSDRRLEAAVAVYVEGEAARRSNDDERAVELYRRAVDLFRESGEDRWEMLAWFRTGQIERRRTRAEAELEAHHRAEEVARAAGLTAEQAYAAQHLGWIHRQASRYPEAAPAYERAAGLFGGLGDLGREAYAWNQLAYCRKLDGELDAARAAYRRSLEIAQLLGAVDSQGTELNNLGELHLSLGQAETALELFQEALKLRQQASDARGVAVTWTSLGNAYRRLGRLDQARDAYRTSLRLYAEAPPEERDRYRRKQANAQIGLGLAEMKARRLDLAERAFTSALSVARDTEQRATEAAALLNLGEVRELRGDAGRARELARDSLGIFEELADPQGQGSASFARARAERLAGRLGEALSWMRRAVKHVEAVREGARIEDFRTSYFARKREYYEHLVDLLMELDDNEPDAGWAEQALAVSERSRARSLLDTLRLSRSGSVLDETLTAERLRAEVLDAETVLLEVSLGDERSHLWLLGDDVLVTHPLPGRHRLDALARRTHRTLRTSRQPIAAAQAAQQLAALSRLLLAPVAEHLGDRRLLVVVEGALQYLPFAVLPDPRTLGGTPSTPLGERHEVVTLPTASLVPVLRALRRRGGGKVAVLADPVFNPDDPRLADREAADASGCELLRLPYSAQEAAAILALVDEDARLAALGFDANLDFVRSASLSAARIVHFATHGRLDAEEPTRSGIELSCFDASGRRREGTLYAYEVYDLELSADLVVLSACETALGREVRGEGLMSLTRGFFHAGAPRVMVSLWAVDDQATAELMRRFYRHLLHDGKTPAAALQAAQATLRQEPRWAAPYFWAGFVLQGDWRK